jgi:hypothetical protein
MRESMGLLDVPCQPCVKEGEGMLDVHCIYTLPVLVTSRHSRASGNPGGKSPGDWMSACAGMTFYWCRTYETDI